MNTQAYRGPACKDLPPLQGWRSVPELELLVMSFRHRLVPQPVSRQFVLLPASYAKTTPIQNVARDAHTSPRTVTRRTVNKDLLNWQPANVTLFWGKAAPCFLIVHTQAFLSDRLIYYSAFKQPVA